MPEPCSICRQPCEPHNWTADMLPVCSNCVAGEHACYICGNAYPAKHLFDLKGCVPGGEKVTCLECKGRLEEREACARTAETSGQVGKDGINITDGVPAEIFIGIQRERYDNEFEVARDTADSVRDSVAAAIRQRTTHKPMVERMLDAL